MPDRIAVIGGGLGGLAAACTLAARGHRVVLFEESAHLGGLTTTLEAEGFRFDIGPTLFTQPRTLDRIFREAGRKLPDYLDLVPLEPQWRCFFPDGAHLDLFADPQTMAQALDAIAPGSGAKYYRFMGHCQRLHEIARRVFFWRSVGGPFDAFDYKRLFSIHTPRDLIALRPGMSAAQLARTYFKDHRIAQFVGLFLHGSGSSLERMPVAMWAAAHIQSDDGVWYPRDGTAMIPKALTRLSEELGVELRKNTVVERIEIENRRVEAVIANGERIPVGAVVSTIVPVMLAGRASDGEPSLARPANQTCSALILLLGLDRPYEHLLHHNFVVSSNPHQEQEFIFTKGEPAPDPTCHISMATQNTLQVLVQTPVCPEWETQSSKYRDVIINKLAAAGGMPDLESRIRFEKVLTPHQMGSLYGKPSHGKFLGMFKSPNRSRDIGGLYYSGKSIHPGPGIAGELMSGWIAADALDHDLGGVISTMDRPE